MNKKLDEWEVDSTYVAERNTENFSALVGGTITIEKGAKIRCCNCNVSALPQCFQIDSGVHKGLFIYLRENLKPSDVGMVKEKS
ncbi:hypothetical protein GYA37_01560 [candidate division WWE3 bacterium]|uniref:Uncharacterized protein n=1 Tax=candidate division WWE3 bacterium TaxID=2053526 RepID=A0A7X9HSC7_UNCKA|nr:hypothetical protein [candidate division WWE3 bacterium]